MSSVESQADREMSSVSLCCWPVCGIGCGTLSPCGYVVALQNSTVFRYPNQLPMNELVWVLEEMSSTVW